MKTERPGFRMLRHEQRMVPPIEDSYRPDAKLPDPTRCPGCGATYRKGRWTWEKSAQDASVHRCPACQRVRDNFPAGYVILKGKFNPELRVQLLNLVMARETRAKAEHPLQRLMAVEEIAGGIRVTTTDAHLARSIAHALRDAFHGSVGIKYSRDENLVRAVWNPEPRTG